MVKLKGGTRGNEQAPGERNGSARIALAAQESERRCLAAELHDEIGQTLTAAGIRIEHAADVGHDSQADLSLIAESVRGRLDKVRHIACELRPEALDDLGLVNALEATVGLASNPYMVILSVIDNGRTLPTDPPTRTAGIGRMRKRARLIDGRLEIDSKPGAGKTVRLELPGERSIRSRSGRRFLTASAFPALRTGVQGMLKSSLTDVSGMAGLSRRVCSSSPTPAACCSARIAS